MPMGKIYPVAAFSDNYIWLLDNGDGTALVVDPGDAEPVVQALRERKLRLSAILLTHHHFDHVGGVEELKSREGCTVYGPENPAIANVDQRLASGHRLDVGSYSFGIIAVPGHTLDHIAYFQAGPEPLLFCGDTLFAGGCGRIFEGTPSMMHESLELLAGLPEDTAVYCAHEYTLANLRFARAADPGNAELEKRERAAQVLRAEGRPTLPSTIGLEKATNPFLRSAVPDLRAGLRNAGRGSGEENPIETFAELRAWKDIF